MITIDPSKGIDLKFKVNLTGTTFEQLSAWASVEPVNTDVVFQIPASIENGVLMLKSTLENVNLQTTGNLKIKVQHGSNLHDVWATDYNVVEKVQIVLEQIQEVKETKVVKEQPKVETVETTNPIEDKEVQEVVTEKVIEKIVSFKDFK